MSLDDFDKKIQALLSEKLNRVKPASREENTNESNFFLSLLPLSVIASVAPGHISLSHNRENIEHNCVQKLADVLG